MNSTFKPHQSQMLSIHPVIISLGTEVQLPLDWSFSVMCSLLYSITAHNKKSLNLFSWNYKTRVILNKKFKHQLGQVNAQSSINSWFKGQMVSNTNKKNEFWIGKKPKNSMKITNYHSSVCIYIAGSHQPPARAHRPWLALYLQWTVQHSSAVSHCSASPSVGFQWSRQSL